MQDTKSVRQPIPLLHRLRQETAAQHQRIEADLNLLAPGFALAQYRALLQRFLGFYLPWENAVQAVQPSLLEGRHKVPHLLQDLRHLELSTEDLSTVAVCDLLPPLRTQAQMLGSMYVLEGATLGGQILQKHFMHKFYFHEQGCTFFSGYGERTGSLWKQFGALVNALPFDDSDEAIRSAVATYQSLHAWLLQ